jgi:hypothetical protein
MVEASLLLPIVLFLFLGTVNMGFYLYAFISVTNAARAAAQATANVSAGNDSIACEVVREELRSLPNVAGLTGCGATPLQVDATRIEDPVLGRQAEVRVSYETIQLFPLPFLSGRMTINRIVTMRVM